MTRPGARAIVVLAVTAAVVLGIAYELHKVWTKAAPHLVSYGCTVDGFDIDTDQAAVASTMVGAVTTYRTALPRRATVLVLAAALQESKLTNLALGEGDRDSVGVLQQRPSQGWGTVSGGPNSTAARVRRLNDVRQATTEFLDALVKVNGWQQMPLADAVQEVQISADGSAYAQHEPEAAALADALQGVRPAGISCTFATPTRVAAPSAVAAQARRQLGITTPVVSGAAVRVPGARWQTAAWFVANADRLGIEEVSYAGRRWTRPDGWRHYSTATYAAVVATMYRR